MEEQQGLLNSAMLSHYADQDDTSDVEQEPANGALAQAATNAGTNYLDPGSAPIIPTEAVNKADQHLQEVIEGLAKRQSDYADSMNPANGMSQSAKLAYLGASAKGANNYGGDVARGDVAAAPFVRQQEQQYENAQDKMSALRLNAAKIEDDRQRGLIQAQATANYRSNRRDDTLARMGLKLDDTGKYVVDPDLMKARISIEQATAAGKTGMAGTGDELLRDPSSTQTSTTMQPMSAQATTITTKQMQDHPATTDAQATADELNNKKPDFDRITSTATADLNLDDKLTNSGYRPKVQADLKAILQGRMLLTGQQMKNPYYQQLVSAANQLDPDYDMTNYNARAKTRQDFTSGKSADNILALNTAVQHLGKLDTDFNGLKNSDFPTYNWIANGVGNYAGNKKIQGASSDVSTDTTAVSHELAKVFRSTGMSEGEVNDWEKKISTSASPTQMHHVIHSAVELMDGRLDALGARYEQGMGHKTDSITLLNPMAQKVYSRLKTLPDDDATATAAPTAATAPGKAAAVSKEVHWDDLQ